MLIKPYDVLKVKRIDANLKEFALFAQRLDFRRNQGYGSGCCSDKKYRRIKSRDFGSETLSRRTVPSSLNLKDRTPSTKQGNSKRIQRNRSGLQTDHFESKASAEEAVTAQAKQEPAAPAATTANNEPSLAAKTAEASKLTSDTQVQRKEKVEAASEETEQKPNLLLSQKQRLHKISPIHSPQIQPRRKLSREIKTCCRSPQ